MTAPRTNASHDQNFTPTLIGVSTSDGRTPVPVEVDPITGQMQVNASVSVSGADGAILDGSNNAIKATVKSLTDANPLAVAIVDTNGDQVTSFGGGTQYTDGDVPPVHPVAGTIEWSDGANWQTVSTAKPLPVAASFSPSGTQDVNLSKVAGSTISQGHGTAATAVRVELPTDGTGVVGVNNASGASAVNIQDGGNSITVDNGGTFAVQATEADGANTTLGSKADAKSTATDTTAITIMQVLKQISASVQAPPSQAVTNAGTFLVQAALNAGTNLIGKVGIDQTTPGTTNAVAATNLPTAVDTNSGPKSASTLRVVLATDQPALTNKLLVTPDSVALPANQSVNVSQINGATPLMGNGTTGTGSQRVTIASDSTGQVTLATGANTIGALTANQSVNLNQLAGNTISSGIGTSGTGTLRIVDANDVGRTLKSASGSASSSGNNTLVVAGTNKLKIYAFSLTTISTTAVTCIFQSGASGTELWRVVLQAPTSVNVGANLAITPPASLFSTASATLLNLNLSGAQTVHWSVAYFDEA